MIANLTTSISVATDAREVRGDYVKHKGGNKTKTSNASIQEAAYQVALAARSLSGIRSLQLRINNLQTKDGS